MVSGDVLGALCGAGLPLLLRYALDDSSTAVISAALSALHSLLVPTWEEVRGVLHTPFYLHNSPLVSFFFHHNPQEFYSGNLPLLFLIEAPQ